MSDDFKTYRANAEGYDGDKIRVEGEVFTTNIPQGSWMDLLDENGNVVERPVHEPVAENLDADIDTLAAASVDKLKKAMSERDDRIAALEAELAAARKPATAQTEPGPLDKSIPELTAYLESISDVGAVDALITAEKGGKSRSGALEALEARKAALQGS